LLENDVVANYSRTLCSAAVTLLHKTGLL